MNSLFNRLKYFFTYGSKMKRMMLSIVILAEVIVLLVVATYAWVETVSSIKITNEANTKGTIDTYVFTEAMIGAEQGTIDIAKYFKQSGDMHFAPASSTDGRTLFFPKVTSAGTAYVSSGTGSFRKSSTSDMNTTYLSITFKLKAYANADFFFVQEPTFSEQSANMRVSITSQTMGSTDSPVTTIYKMADTSQETCVNTVDGGTASVTVKKIEDHIKGKTSENRLFAVGAEETKIVTINVWLSGTTLDSSLPEDISISNFGITSNLTPRRVTLIPTSRWDDGGQTFYAWCWAAPGNNKNRLYKLSLDQETEHYCFDYNGSYTKTTFIRAVSGCTVEEGEYNSWPFSNSNAANTNGCLKQTVDTSIPTEPLDPTFAIDTYNGGNGNKSTGVWASPDLVTYKLAYANGQNSSCGTLSATTYIGTSTSTNVMETTNTSNSNSLHHNTVHALPGKKVKLTATAKANYAFVGWYSDAEETTLVSANAEYSFDASAEAPVEQTYYAKFMKMHTTSIYVTPRVNWGNNYYIRLYQGSGNNVIDSINGFVQATYDSNTGYYKANFTTTKTGTFYAILAKDTNHTDKVPSEGGYTGTLGTSYVFKHNQSDSELTEYDSQRCIWFIDGTTNHFIGDDSAKMRIDNWSATYDMRSIGNYCYIYEYTTGTDFSNARGITFKRTSSSNEQLNYWNTSPTSGKSQYTATGTGDNNGSWTN